MNFEVATLLDMKNLGKLIASDVAPGQIWHVEGELGVGKTTLIQFILASLGVTDSVLSPTFSIYEPYEGSDGFKFLHMDLYRIANPATLVHIGLDFYEDGEHVWFVEWPNLGGDVIPAADGAIRIARLTQERKLIVAISRKGSAVLD